MLNSKVNLQNLMSADDVESVIQFLLRESDAISEEVKNDVVLLSARLNRIEKGKRNGTISESEYTLEKNRISHAISEIYNNHIFNDINLEKDLLISYLKILYKKHEKISNEYIGVRIAEYKGSDTTKNQYWFEDILKSSNETQSAYSEKIVILGDPGAGKSTCFQKSVWDICNSQIKSLNTNIIPIYFELNSFSSYSLSFKKNNYTIILEIIAESWNRLFIGEKKQFILTSAIVENLLKEKQFIFFFDGLNEVGDLLIENLLKCFKDFLDVYSNKGHLFLFSTRKLDFEHDFRNKSPFNKDFNILEILEFNTSAINEFILRDLGKINLLIKDSQLGFLGHTKIPAILSELSESKYYSPVSHINNIKNELFSNDIYPTIIASLGKSENLINTEVVRVSRTHFSKVKSC